MSPQRQSPSRQGHQGYEPRKASSLHAVPVPPLPPRGEKRQEIRPTSCCNVLGGAINNHLVVSNQRLHNLVASVIASRAPRPHRFTHHSRVGRLRDHQVRADHCWPHICCPLRCGIPAQALPVPPAKWQCPLCAAIPCRWEPRPRETRTGEWSRTYRPQRPNFAAEHRWSCPSPLGGGQ